MTGAHAMNVKESDTLFALLKLPSAWIPLALSFACLLMFVGFLVFVGKPATPAQDEGVPAHLFQLLMGVQIPIVSYFMLRWLPRDPARGMVVLALVLIGWIAACLPVYLLEHSSSL